MHIKEYIDSEKLTISDFAKIVGISSPYVYILMHKQREPGKRLAKEIEQLTYGKIAVKDLITRDKKKHCPCCGKRVSVKKKLNDDLLPLKKSEIPPDIISYGNIYEPMKSVKITPGVQQLDFYSGDITKNV
jgi:transcriptional regulator with XRE-family HTH domain